MRDGYQVAITGRTESTLKAVGPHVYPIVADLADPASVVSTLHQVNERFGALDVLVLNAGGPRPGRILDLDDSAWLAAFDLLLRGPLSLARAALPAMAARGFGRVVFVTSTAVRQPQPDLAASVVLRAAVTAAAKLLSREYAADGVTVNCVAPGPTDTARRREILHRKADQAGTSYDEADAQDVALVPAGRAGNPDEIGAAVAFLASDAASYVNGTVLTVDGGRTETI